MIAYAKTKRKYYTPRSGAHRTEYPMVPPLSALADSEKIDSSYLPRKERPTEWLYTQMPRKINFTGTLLSPQECDKEKKPAGTCPGVHN